MLDAAASDRQILHVSAVAAPEELLKYLSATQQRRLRTFKMYVLAAALVFTAAPCRSRDGCG